MSSRHLCKLSVPTWALRYPRADPFAGLRFQGLCSRDCWEWAPEPPVLVARTRRRKAWQIARDQLAQAVRVSVLSAGELLEGRGNTVAATDCHWVFAILAISADGEQYYQD